jgi:nitronate monooxygenase
MPLKDPLTRWHGRLRLPLVAAPMFLVSGIELVVAACRAGVVGAFPTINCRSSAELDDWLTRIDTALQTHSLASEQATAPWCANLVVHPSNPRLAGDLQVLCRHRPELVITSVGDPTPVLARLHEAGACVWSDVASLHHARRAIAAGVDGLVLLSAGAGGQTGHLNPLAFVRAVRAFYDGPLVLGGGISDGVALRAAQVLGCDLAYMGTRFIATHESLASDAYRQMLVASTADDVLLTRAFTGLPANLLRPSIVAAGLDPRALPEAPAVDVARDLDPQGTASPFRRWKDLWSAGHSVSGVQAIGSVAELVDELAAQYADAAVR